VPWDIGATFSTPHHPFPTSATLTCFQWHVTQQHHYLYERRHVGTSTSTIAPAHKPAAALTATAVETILNKSLGTTRYDFSICIRTKYCYMFIIINPLLFCTPRIFNALMR
jgi:hypothetical protein